MGGSLNSVYNNTSFALNLHYKAMVRLQEQAYTGSRINRASDDPSTAYQVLGLKSQQTELGNYMDTISQASSVLEISSAVIDDIASAITTTKVSLTQVSSETYTSDDRLGIVEQINNILEQMVSLANTKHLGQYIFSGDNTDLKPYAVQRTNGEITSVTYQGSDQQRDIEVAPGVQSSAYHVGEEIFRSDNRTAPEFTNVTGAAAGSGTSNIKGDAWLTVTDDGAGSYDLSIDDGATKINVAAAADITNIAVTNSSGDVLYIDATNIGSAGVDMVSVPGTHDIFGTLIGVRDSLENQRGLSNVQLKQCREKLSGSLDEMRTLLVGKTVSVGFKIGFIDDLKNSLENIKFDTVAESTALQEADIAQVVIDLSRRDILYQMSLSVAGKLMSMSLLDFIR